MVGLQWCAACDAPRFRWSVCGRESIPMTCWHCGTEAIEARLVAESLAQLRRELGDWALGAQRRRAGWTHESVNRRRSHVRAKFDTVLGWWIRQPNRDPELARLLTDYHNRARVHVDGNASHEPADAVDQAQPKMLDPSRLHELTEQTRVMAEEARAERKIKKPRANP